MASSNTSDGSDLVHIPFQIPLVIRFWILLIFEIPSLLCTLFVLYHLIIDRISRLALHIHVVLLLLLIALIAELLDIPWNLNYLRLGIIAPQEPSYCLIAWLIEFGCYNICTILMAWASIERHILIFHERWLATHNKRLLIHYFPLAAIVIYGIIFYIKVILFPNCENMFDYSQAVCGAFPCYQADPFLAMWDILINGAIPTLMIALFSVTLLIRVIVQKRSLGRRIEWRRYRKMTIQLLSLSVLYLFINFPLMLIVLVHLCGFVDWAVDAQSVFYYLTYPLWLLLPFVSLNSVPDCKRKFFKLIFRRQPRAVVPVT